MPLLRFSGCPRTNHAEQQQAITSNLFCNETFVNTPVRSLTQSAYPIITQLPTTTMVQMAMVYLAALWSATHTLTVTHAFAFSSMTSKSMLRRPLTPRNFSYLCMSTTMKTTVSSEVVPSEQKKIPITFLSGFLGSGKTSTLQHLLQNKEDVKIGVIVNDVASVNIDAKLVSSGSTLSNLQDGGVVELQNGCACCTLSDELLTSLEIMLSRGTGQERPLDAVVVELSGVADPLAVKSNWDAAIRDGHPITEKAEVSQIVTLVDAATFGTDWMTWDLAADRRGWVEDGDDCAGQLKVPVLLAEQVEAADILLINKIDMAGPEQVALATALAKEMNEKATVELVSFGRVSPNLVLKPKTVHKHVHEEKACAEPGCSDPTHSHDHAHSHSHESHSQTEASSTHPESTTLSHSHEHSHSHIDDMGITNFVYKADRAFNTRQLMALLSKWPVPIKDELDLSLLKEAQDGGYEVAGDVVVDDVSPFVGVLRSKGFCWFAPTRWSGPQEDVWRHDTVMYWSHAGKHFGITPSGRWWGTLSREHMKQYFKGNMGEYDRIIKEDFVSEEFGDRRQELVFIGVGLDKSGITDALNRCLISEKGMNRYRQELKNFMDTGFSVEAGGGPSLFSVGSVDHMDL
jgi:G3E family GTPase